MRASSSSRKVIFPLLLAALALSSPSALAQDYTQYVNPMVGTRNIGPLLKRIYS